MKSTQTILIIGGGASGFFSAIHAKEAHPLATVIILESGASVLQKVKISGGGRCNVTHACFDSNELMSHYPRGGKALLGMFHRFQPSDTMDWFEKRGVKLKVEADNRVFPESDSSQSIVDCLLHEAKTLGVEIYTKRAVKKIIRGQRFLVKVLNRTTEALEELEVDHVILATGGSVAGFKLAESLGHQLYEPLPSLFTFTIKEPELHKLAGLSVKNVHVSVNLPGMETNKTKEGGFKDRTLSKVPSQQGPMLVTHWGVSGPSIIKLSAWGARDLAQVNYTFNVMVDWVPAFDNDEVLAMLKEMRTNFPDKQLGSKSPWKELPLGMWKYILNRGPQKEKRIWTRKTWSQLSAKTYGDIIKIVKQTVFFVEGKSRFKEEFVTSGGIALEEMDTRTMESKKCPGLFIVGELLNIDGVTGGFNFQNAWTTGFLAGTSIK